MNTRTAAKFLCSNACHVAFHRKRTKDYPQLSPHEFKQLILNMFREGLHPNKKHPINLLSQTNQEFAEVLDKRSENA
ncbi:hypothetical protein [Aquipseudomonas alcaligenes]|uniref:hypothetical protein n=1 Tax=Aquipseudomonas alcaligenes TaxID=43263 RepID=UPI001115A5F3|nr:hypothetical protein [Pseudomonas alcaligenes]